MNVTKNGDNCLNCKLAKEAEAEEEKEEKMNEIQAIYARAKCIRSEQGSEKSETIITNGEDKYKFYF